MYMCIYLFVVATGNVEHSLKLGPDSNEACVNFTISMEEALTFSVISNETENIRIPNPNGTVIGIVITLHAPIYSI